MHAVISDIAASLPYKLLVLFFGLYPMVSALMWIGTSFIFFFRRERRSKSAEAFYDVPDDDLPFVSVVVPAFSEELTVCGTMAAMMDLDYPRLEIVLVNDGSPDSTLTKARSYLLDERVRIINKTCNQGKAMALNDTLPLLNGSLMLIIDGDSAPHADSLRWMVPHFLKNPRLAAVTGNPRVRNRSSLLAKIQTVEFSSIVSLLKRAQVVWGRVMTVSGVMTLYRVSALEDVGLFVHDASTEDISTSWKLQRRKYDVRYEPRAMVDMQVPPTLEGLWKQRRRWAKGLAQVLRRNAGIWTDWSQRRLYPVYLEATLSILWAYSFVLLTAAWLVTWLLGAPLLGATPVPALWGMLIATISLVQLWVGVWMDRRYDPSVTRYYAWAAWYPLIYWIQMAIITVISTPSGLLHPVGEGTWHTPRETEPAPRGRTMQDAARTRS
jgi:biofilm PGA synthesis N-glycosyltransferase PgaC